MTFPWSAWRVTVLAVVTALSGCGLFTATESDGTGVLLFAPAATALSVSITGPRATAMLGKLLTRVWRGPATLLAGRRLYEDPGASCRFSSGVVPAVFLGSVASTLLPAGEESVPLPGAWAGMTIGTLVTVPAGYCAVIMTVASAFDRRHAFGALIAVGAPVRVLRRTLLMELALPTLIAAAGAGTGGVATGVAVLRLFGTDTVIGVWMAAPALLGGGVAILATSACGPALHRIGTGP